MQQYNTHEAGEPVVKRDFTFKSGHGGIWAILIGICAFFFIRWIAPLLIAGCLFLELK
jgi:hypothetical protein